MINLSCFRWFALNELREIFGLRKPISEKVLSLIIPIIAVELCRGISFLEFVANCEIEIEVESHLMKEYEGLEIGEIGRGLLIG